MFWQRALSALVLVPVVVASTWIGDPWFTGLVALAALLGVAEFYRLARQARWQPFTVLGGLFTLLLVMNPHLGDQRTAPFLLSSAVVLTMVRLLRGPLERDNLINWAWTLGGILYVGWMMSHFVLLREVEHGRSWVLLSLLATFASDSCAYLVGRTWGRHYMAKLISPRKTWEGAIGGVVGAIAAVAVVAAMTELGNFGFGLLLPLGLLISVFAQLGDLAESMLKRGAGVKETGRLIPGHGGVLDRLDSVIFTVVLTYYYVVWVMA